ncbi:MAG: hypothetical protein JSU72_00145 [Deltaproteobacteria bacterium]|nr:MAG: hypothetical protein JSU72_00145 [Deltaproteobacteria bacterium]
MDLTDDTLASVDARELEADIDRAIDELFVQKGGAPDPASLEEEPPEKAEEKPAEESTLDLVTEPAVELLAPLKESLLTLDWEISTHNIRAFEKELQVVSEDFGEDRHGMAVIKMTQGVLKYLHATKGSAAPISIQFLHAATRGLDLFLREPGAESSERGRVMEELLGQFRRLKAEIQKLKPRATPPAEEVAAVPAVEPVAQPVTPEEPEPEPSVKEELSFEELPEERPLMDTLPEHEPLLEEFLEDEAFPEETQTEDSPFDDFLETEQLLEGLPEEEPLLEDLPEEEPILEQVVEEELASAPLGGEKPKLDELPEEEPVIELSFEPAEATPAGATARVEIPGALRQLTQETRRHSKELSTALAALTQETGNFFGHLMQTVAGKPGLEKLESLFGNVEKTLGEKLTNAQALSGNLDAAVRKLEQSLGQLQEGAIAPGSQAVMKSEVERIQQAVQILTKVASRLKQNPSDIDAEQVPNSEDANPDSRIDTPEFSVDSLESEEAKETFTLELTDQLPPEPSGAAPPSLDAIYLANVAASTLGLPTDRVANVFKISKGKAKALRKRGYARLTDFKAAFRSLKRGMTGPLADQEVKSLKRIRFPLVTLSPETLGSHGIKATGSARGIVLFSTGERHGALFTDEVMQRIPYDVMSYREAGLSGEVSGTAIIEGDFEISVIDPDYVIQ